MNTQYNNKYVVYTAIFGNYDLLQEPIDDSISKEIDFICFTDNLKLKSKNWKIEFFNPKTLRSNSQKNRYLKLLAPYNELYNYQKSLYIDGNIQIKSNLLSFFNKYNKSPLYNFKHPQRNCIYEEINACIEQKKGNKEGLILQKNIYKKKMMPKNYGLSDNKIILRDHKSDKTKSIMYEWWEHVEKYSGRDQVCLPYVLFLNHYNFVFFDEDILSNKYFFLNPHRKEFFRRFWRFLKKHSSKRKFLSYIIQIIENKVKPKLIP